MTAILATLPCTRAEADAVALMDEPFPGVDPAPTLVAADEDDVWELNEAFAAVVLKWVKDLDLDMNKVNVNGGAIAMGHPLGATGAMILGTLLDELERRDLKRGLATLCVGAGMGVATIIERIEA